MDNLVSCFQKNILVDLLRLICKCIIMRFIKLKLS